jgi:hypothetical protein
MLEMNPLPTSGLDSRSTAPLCPESPGEEQITGGESHERCTTKSALAQQTSNFYDTPSKQLKKSPIMNLVTKTVATYMFLKNMNNRQGKSKGTTYFLKRRCEAVKTVKATTGETSENK